MAKSKTKVINNTGSDVILKLSTGGIISKLSDEPLKHGAHYFISIDLMTTYREYWCAVRPSTNQEKVILSSDVCAEYSEVTLTTEYVTNSAGIRVPRYKWEGTQSRDPKRNKSAQRSSSSTQTNTQTPVNAASGAQGTPLNASGSGRPARKKSSDSRCTIL